MQTKAAGERPPDKNENDESLAAQRQDRLSKKIVNLGGRRNHHSKLCETCGIAFTPLRAWHRRCKKCYSWCSHGHYVGLMATALRGAR